MSRPVVWESAGLDGVALAAEGVLEDAVAVVEVGVLEVGAEVVDDAAVVVLGDGVVEGGCAVLRLGVFAEGGDDGRDGGGEAVLGGGAVRVERSSAG